MNYKAKLKDINTFIFDIDGVFTDNIVYLTSDGEQMRTANVRDGYAVQLAVKKGLRIAIISGGKNEIVRKRFESLGVKDIFLGSSEKMTVFNNYLQSIEVSPEAVCYMGDDIPDWPVLKASGLAVCPADAAYEIREICHYISPKEGGKGCVRDILEQALKIKGLWMDAEGHVW
ncbi:MAG: KdsC family phosphatase [Flavobacteriales bacterium]|jgi:3-deoxy-D-manno-octulosonate 8-phosphate phosphatase (KDO 8-P phosphatase)